MEKSGMFYARDYPVPDNERSRLAEVKRHNILDTPPEKSFDNIVKLAVSIFDVEMSLVSIVSDDRQWFKSRVGFLSDEMPRRDAFCAHAILSNNVMIVPDALEDARFRNYQSVIGPPYIRFYAGAPLTTRSGANIGTLCLADTRSRDTFDLDDSAQLASLAKIVTIQMSKKINKLSTRSEDRFDIHVRGTVSHYGLKPTDIDILNISNRGAMLRVVDITFARGDEVLISINTVAIFATIAWSKEDLYGLTFHRPIDAHALEEIHSYNEAL
jgi:GAF domain-containing protein